MALYTNKVSEVYGGQDIASLSDRPNEDGLTSSQLKARFDNLIKNLIPKHNTLIDALIVILESGASTNGHTHNMDNLVDGAVNRLFTEVLKLKLDGIQASAEVNQNAFSSIKVGATTGNANSKTATFEIVAGLNIVASIDPLTNKVTLSASGTLATQAVQSLIDDIGNYFTSLEVNGALQEIGASLYPSLSKTIPVDADTILLSDSASSGVFKKLTWANIKATLKTYFDTIYQAILVSGTTIKTINSTNVLGSGDIVVQPALVSGTNIKTINGSSILASGDVELLPKNNPIATGTQTLPNIVTNGIKFPATQVPSADANTLDDYEEGTFIPSFTNLTIGNGLLFGHYTKNGNIVNLIYGFKFGSTSSITGSLDSHTNLPFVTKNIDANAFVAILGVALDVGANYFDFTARLQNNAASTASGAVRAGTTTLITATYPFTWVENDTITFNVTYQTN